VAVGQQLVGLVEVARFSRDRVAEPEAAG